MPDSTSLRNSPSVGRRIKAIRKQRGYDQNGLAQRSHLSYSTITKVESGHLAASPMVTAACARALRVPVTDLTGQPYHSALKKDQLEDLVQPLRHVLANPTGEAEGAAPPRELSAVRGDIAALEDSRVRGEYLAIGAKGPVLISELEQITRDLTPGAKRERACSDLANAYCLARYFAHKLGFLDLGLLALNHMERASALSGDEFLPAVVCHYRSDYLLHHGGYDRGLRDLEALERSLHQAVTRGDSRALSVQGTLHLKAAVTHARRGGPQAAVNVTARLKEAREVARRRGDQPDPYGLIFDALNVAVHAVSTRIDLGEPEEAVALGQELHLPSGWALNRRGHHLMDMARAYEQVGRAAEALGALVAARDAAPAQTRYHPTTRETVHALLRRRGEPPRALRVYARWLGM